MRINAKRKAVLLFIILLLGAVLRIGGCWWGAPEQLHPDEATVVISAKGLIERHSFEPSVYLRPDHFEIKCDAILFNLYSYIAYGQPASDVFNAHTFEFYLIARCFTAAWGIFMIWIGYLVLERIWRGTGLIGAFLIAFFPTFITHSHYATPDIPLSTVFLICIYYGLGYLENGDKKSLALTCLFTAIACTIKYTGAVLCALIAAMVLYKSIEERNTALFFRHGFLALGLVLAFLFLISPSLFTNMEAVIAALKNESRSTHMGADGLGFFGNLLFYLKSFLQNTGALFLLPVLAGIWQCFRQDKKALTALGIGVIYWMALSVLALHWERWGLPMYLAGVLFGAIGVRFILEWIDSCGRESWRKWGGILAKAAMGCVALSMVCGSIAHVAVHIAKDSRLAAKKYCEENGISAQNTVFDGYTPFSMESPVRLSGKLELRDGALFLKEERDADAVCYLIVSGGIFDRVYAQSGQYQDQYALYEYIRNSQELVQAFPTPKLKAGYSSIGNIVRDIQFLTEVGKTGYAGYDIEIYRVSFS